MLDLSLENNMSRVLNDFIFKDPTSIEPIKELCAYPIIAKIRLEDIESTVKKDRFESIYEILSTIINK